MPQTVVCLGDPVVDILSHVSMESLKKLDLEAGGCIAVETSTVDSILANVDLTCPLSRVSGGSAANVAKGLANLAVRTGDGDTVSFAGRIGNDAAGREYEEHLTAQGVRPLLCRSDSLPTATCLCLVTPDGQRTMRTCLAASSELQSTSQLSHAWLEGCKLLHVEGYVMYRPGLAKEALQAARKAGALISIDLASFELIKRCQQTLQEILQAGLIDIVVCNEEEAITVGQVFTSATGASEALISAAQEFLLHYCQVSIVSLGAAGCIIRKQGGREAIQSTAPAVSVVDTVGAGDNFTAGVLHAFLRGAPLQACGQCGCLVGSASVQTAGAELPQACWETLRAQIHSICSNAASEADGKVGS